MRGFCDINDKKVRGLPFDRYSWLTTHNSFARLGVRSGTGGVLLTPTNQQDSITDQLNVSKKLVFISFCFFPLLLCLYLFVTEKNRNGFETFECCLLKRVFFVQAIAHRLLLYPGNKRGSVNFGIHIKMLTYTLPCTSIFTFLE